jgi:hypothetical protein
LEAAELRHLRGRSGRRRRFRTTRLDSLDGSEEGGTADLLEILSSLVEVSNGGVERRPWRPARTRVGKKAGKGERTTERERG